MNVGEVLIVGSIVASIAYLGAMAASAVVFAVRRGGRREDPVDNYDAVSASRFTIPVSLVVPIANDGGPLGAAHGDRDASTATAINATIAGLLGLNYPELEVIVVAEAMPEETWTSVKDAWDLEAKEFFYRQSLATSEVRMIYRSAREPRLMVVDKAPAGRADAVNCGVNLARFRYVGAVNPGITFDADALLRAMAAPLRDPAAVVAASTHVETRGDAVQRLISIRSLMGSRMASDQPQLAPQAHDSVLVWRRDAIVQLEGFSSRAADTDLDMTIRLHTSPKITGHVVRSVEIFGHMRPRSIGDTLRLAARRQLAALQAVRVLMAPGPASRRSLLYVLTSEVLTPAARAWAILATVVACAAGWMVWTDAALVAVLLSFAQAMTSGAALLVRGAAPGAPDRPTLQRMLLAAPLEFALSGPIALCGRAAGLWAFVTEALS